MCGHTQWCDVDIHTYDLMLLWLRSILFLSLLSQNLKVADIIEKLMTT